MSINSNTSTADARVKVSLIIPTYRREALLVDTLKCALAQDCEDYEILVVDQTPQHEAATAEFLRENADGIRYMLLDAPSLTEARNAGMRAARGDIFVFVDDDTSFDANFLSCHAEAYRSGVGAVQGRVIENKGKESSRPLRLRPWLKFTGGINCPIEGKTNTFMGCNFSLSRAATKKVGEFDTRYKGVAIHEESDYAVRVVRSGYEIRHAPAACLVHHRAEQGGVGDGGETLFFNIMYYYNELLFAKKHFSRPAIWIFRLRLKRRGRRILRRLIKRGEEQAAQALESE